ncbi:chemotaxis protein CheW [Sphaerotilus mobilis]|uniref:Twitching motility protein PilI n=1 Tax=Sphaerotilus mobilis TaxID=47994 RepID=A0A4Q7LLY4_9BURK|nr:chemotaxis protein CheW [Sphaerotilus mobilis]RZS54668.1 twitching motility protein PilI [Sphaerotilus mobilis]
MANKEALRELQGRLAERLHEVKTQERVQSWLAVEAGGCGFLFPLSEAGEIFQCGALVRVPHASPWFLGVANLRGVLAGVIDLGRYLGLRGGASGDAAEATEQDRVIAFNPSLDVNAALRVDHLAGLRNASQLSLMPDDGVARPGFVGARYRDAAGRIWVELRLALLARDERFLRIVGAL